jgi:hypothetical protein
MILQAAERGFSEKSARTDMPLHFDKFINEATSEPPHWTCSYLDVPAHKLMTVAPGGNARAMYTPPPQEVTKTVVLCIRLSCCEADMPIKVLML